MIPKKLHFIWVGDESRQPNNCIDTWRKAHPDWEVRVWGNDDLSGRDWINARHMNDMSKREWNGVADLMRWEILHEHGGIVCDADSICVRPLDDDLLDCPAFACWENEIARPGLIAAGYFGSEPANPFVKAIIDDIAAEPSVVHKMAWETVGPMRLTHCYRKFLYTPLQVYPSHYFIPRHFTGVEYSGSGPVYAKQMWGSTLRAYEHLHQADVAVMEEAGMLAVPATREGTQPSQATAPAAPTATPPPATAEQHGSQLEQIHAPYFLQKVAVSAEVADLSRVQVFQNLCQGKRVLHVGCADWPITDLNASLHLALQPHCAVLDGVDLHVEALDMLRPHVTGELFSDISQANGQYDVVIVPEVMEHVANVEAFLAELEAINASCWFISVPDAFQCRAAHFDYNRDTETFYEAVHPDHNVWYTPYTFANTIQKYSNFQMHKMWFFNRISLLTLLTKPQIC